MKQLEKTVRELVTSHAALKVCFEHMVEVEFKALKQELVESQVNCNTTSKLCKVDQSKINL